MTSELITDNDVWRRLTAAVQRTKRPTFAAVAYLGRAGSRLLPLRSGSRLVVNASRDAVVLGQTCPSELALLADGGVRVFSHESLHAKLFVVGNRVYVGSANASSNSAQNLLEAVVVTADPKVVIAARRYVRKLCQHELGPEELHRLKKIYRPPRVVGRGYPRRRSFRSLVEQGLPQLRVIQLVRRDPPAGAEEIERAGGRAAKRKMNNRRTHELQTFFWWGGESSFREGDQVVQVVKEANGQRFVDPVAVVIHTERRRRGKTWLTYVFLEVPKRRRKSLLRLARQLGYGAKKRLSRSGKIRDETLAEKIRTAWGI